MEKLSLAVERMLNREDRAQMAKNTTPTPQKNSLCQIKSEPMQVNSCIFNFVRNYNSTQRTLYFVLGELTC